MVPPVKLTYIWFGILACFDIILMAKPPSSRHHYLPIFQIKGFLNENGCLYVYDKHLHDFHPEGERTPKQIFYEWNRNMFLVNGKQDDYVENLYSRIDNDLSLSYERVTKGDYKTPLEIFDRFEMILFAGLTFWRIPRTDEEIHNLIDGSETEDLHIKIYDENGPLPSSHEIYSRILKLDHFRQGYRMIKPLFDYISAEIHKTIDDWNFYYASADVKLHLIVDNPIILADDKIGYIFETELIFPLSNGCTLFHTKGKKLIQLAPDHRVLVDTLLFIQSAKYAAGPNREYLEQIAELASSYNTNDRIQNLRKQIFNIFI